MTFSLNENIKIAINSIKANKLRAYLTMLIIFFGITALVGISSAIDAMKESINANFANMGANSFTIRNSGTAMRVKSSKKRRTYTSIAYKEAERFKEIYHFPAKTSISTMASFNARLKFESEKTNPNIQVFGSDENYIDISGYEIEQGRNFSPLDITNSTHVVIIGKDVEFALFKGKQKALNKYINLNGGKYKVIAVLSSKGNSMGFGGDKICIIPLSTARQYFGGNGMSFTINVMTPNALLLDPAIDEATGVFRKIRKVRVGDDDNFEITRSDNLATMLISLTSKASMGAIVIGIITLIGASIGLMNIMLVSVSERTREIGIRKALGATANTIKNQFLIESIVICICGGFFGIVMGIIAANLISFNLSSTFFIPWTWIILGFTICFIVGLISGYMPAKRASQLDPIESLRFE